MVYSTAEKLIQARAGGKVERCHGIPHQGSYNNAAHSWGVAMLMHYLWPEDFPRLALACLAHDVPEAWVGDIPAPTMRYVPGVREALGKIEGNINRSLDLPGEDDLSHEDHLKLKACDRLEFWLWCMEQMALGNGFAAEALVEIERYFDEVPLPKEAAFLFGTIKHLGILPKQAGIMRDAALAA